MKKLMLRLCCCMLLLAAVGCGASTTEKESKHAEAPMEVEPAILQVDDLLAMAPTLIDQPVEVEGVCTHLCSHGGRKMFLMGDSSTLRVESGALERFPQEVVNSAVRVKGKVVESRIDEAYLQNWESQLAAHQEEKHGNDASGCDTEKKARQEEGNTAQERIADFRARIAARNAKEGKPYLSFYHVEATSYALQ